MREINTEARVKPQYQSLYMIDLKELLTQRISEMSFAMATNTAEFI